MAVSLGWNAVCVTDVGCRRKINEDACLSLPERGLWLVADGMGGHDAGDVASQMVVESLRSVPPPQSLGSFVAEVSERLQLVNARLQMEARRRQKAIIGTTVAALLAYEDHGVYLWAGDSRVYLHREGELRSLSRDHSQVEELVARGMLTREEAEHHPNANVITRAVGGAETLELEAEILELWPGDLFLLCSDGLTKELAEAEIGAELLRTPGPEAAQALVQTALARGARDNVTALVVRIEPSPAAAPEDRW